MIRSMTGFGHAPLELEGGRFEVEVRSVNHRFLDLRIKLPRALSSLEQEVRERVQARFVRGKVDLNVSAAGGVPPAPRLELDLQAAEQYAQAAEALCRSGAASGKLDVSTLLGLPGVSRFVEPELTPESARQPLLRAVEGALEATEAMRVAEGEALDRDLRERLRRVEELSGEIEARAVQVQEAVRDRLRKRADQLAQEFGVQDEARLHQEIVIAADRLDVAEEVCRLRSHVEQFRSTLDAGEPAGRRLDFLLQEMVREINTVGSKGNDAPVAHLVVELKTEQGRLREQVQNVE